ncbi:MAG: aliphatic sulfonate ABC transporter substrate-binding protein [Castellaniella sp.]
MSLGVGTTHAAPPAQAQAEALVNYVTGVAGIALNAADTGADAKLAGDTTVSFKFVSGTPGWHHSMAFLADKLGTWKDVGATGVQYTAMNSGTAAGEAIGSGRVDAGYTNMATALALITKGAPITIISGTSQGGNGVVTVNPDIKTVDDLKGKKIAVPQGNTAHELMFRLHVLPSAGLSYDDIKRIPLNPQDMTVALIRGDVDAAVMFDPFMGGALREGARFLVEPKDMWDGGAYSSALLVNNKLLENNPALVQAIADMHAQMVKLLSTEPDKVSEIMSGITHQDLKETRSSWNTVVFKAEADTASFQEFVNGMKDIGLIDTAPDLSTAVVSDFIDRARTKVGM